MTLQRLILIVVVGAALWFGWRWLNPDDEAQIRAVLERIAETVGGAASEQGEVGRLARAASIRSALDPQITVDAGPPFSRMAGRDAIIGTIARMNTTARDLDIQFSDVQVNVAPDAATARVYLTAEAYYRDEGGARGLEARELDLTFRRLDGDWVVADVALVRTLDPPPPR